MIKQQAYPWATEGSRGNHRWVLIGVMVVLQGALVGCERGGGRDGDGELAAGEILAAFKSQIGKACSNHEDCEFGFLICQELARGGYGCGLPKCIFNADCYEHYGPVSVCRRGTCFTPYNHIGKPGGGRNLAHK